MFDFSSWIANFDMINITLASLYIMCGFVVGRFAGKFFGKVVRNMNLEGITKRLKITSKPEVLVENGVSYLIYIIAIVFGLQKLGMPPFTWVIITILLVVLGGLIIALSVKEFIPNLVIGAYLRKVKHLKPQEKVKLAGVRGTVKKIGLFETEIVTKDKNIMLFPNSYFAKRIKLRLKR